MKILMAASCPGDPNLGVPGVMHALAERWRRDGHEVRMRFRDRPGRLEEMLFGWRLSRCADAAWADVVDVHAVEAWPLCARSRRPAVVARSHGLELVVHRNLLAARARGEARISPIYWAYRGSLRLAFERRAARQADAFLTLNASDQAICLGELGGDPARAIQVPNGFPPEFLSEPRSSGTGVAFVGSWLPRKGNDLAVRAITKVLARRPDQEILLAGTGASAETVLADLPEQVRPRVRVVPGFRRQELPSILRGCGILLFPSRSEGYPLSLVEAMACGLVPVASAIPGVVDVVEDGECGTLSPSGDWEAMADSILRLQADPARLEAMGRAARRRVEPTSWDSLAGRQLELFRSILRRRAGEASP